MTFTHLCTFNSEYGPNVVCMFLPSCLEGLSWHWMPSPATVPGTRGECLLIDCLADIMQDQRPAAGGGTGTRTEAHSSREAGVIFNFSPCGWFLWLCVGPLQKNNCKHLYCAGHCSKHFTYMNAFNPHKSPMWQVPYYCAHFTGQDSEAQRG